MGKTLQGATKEDLAKSRIEFDYKGKGYSIPIETSFSMKDMTPTEVKDYLNQIPAKFSYWKSLQVTLEREIEEMEEDFEVWYQQCYMDVDSEYPKKTEGWKKSKVLLDNSDEYRRLKRELRNVKDINKKINVIVSGYNTMTWTLREIARLTYAEMNNIEIRGRGTLAGMQ